MRAVRRLGRIARWGALALGIGLVAHFFWLRPWMLGWGATEAEQARIYPGEALVPVHRLKATRAISLPAPPDRVFPWLVQIGTGRAGWYSYDWLDNGGEPSADRILDAYQGLKAGDRVPVSPDGAIHFPVLAVETPRTLLLGGREAGFAGVWGFHLAPEGAHGTRLVVRFVADAGPTPWGMAGLLALEPINFVMERKMLLNLRARLER